MADQAHLDIILKEGVEAWNEWRTHNPSITPDLSSADLREAWLPLANLSGANLSGADLTKANLWEADLSEANLTGADLSDATLSGANLSEANLSGANLSDAQYLTQHQINQAKGDKKTQLPEGLKRPAAWSQ